MKPNMMIAAAKHIADMKKKYSKQIEDSIKRTKIYQGSFNYGICSPVNTTIKLDDVDSVEAISKYHDGKTAVLNFASYKHPGGGYTGGAIAQEECLCHASTLYNVLREQKDFYAYNNSHLNDSMYTDRALYSPDIVFCNEEDILCDVITCAAPNACRLSKSDRDSMQVNSDALRKRIELVLSIAADNNVDTLILGAYGCGVFKQDPIEVATIFKELLLTAFKNVFTTVVFAIPGAKSENYKAFENIITRRE